MGLSPSARSKWRRSSRALEESLDSAVRQHPNRFGGWDLRKAGHGHDVAGQRDNEACTSGRIDIPNCDTKTGGAAKLGGIIGEGVLSLGYADRRLPQAHRLTLRDVLVRDTGVVHAGSAIDLPGDGLDFFLDRPSHVVQRLEGGLLLVENGQHLACYGFPSLTALGPDIAQRRTSAPAFGGVQ